MAKGKGKGTAKGKAKGAAGKAKKKRKKSKLGGTCATCKSCASLRDAMKEKQGQAKEKLTPEQKQSLDDFKKHYEANKEHYQKLSEATDRPPELIAAMNWRESPTPGEFNTYLHNGQKLGKPTTIAPVGKNFGKDEFDKAAKDALKMHDYCAKSMKMNKDTKDRAAMNAYAETYNGRGPGAGGYVWSGTDQAPGTRYASDGNLVSGTDAKPGTNLLLQSIGVD